MVGTVSEVVRAYELIRKNSAILAARGVETTQPPIGIMVEIPSVLYLIKEIAEQVDFFSIGTSDLAQYLMASVRENPDVTELHDHFQLSVLRAIATVIDVAQAVGRKVSVCGELASDSGGATLLAGMGIDELGVSVSSLGRVKRVLNRLSYAQVRALVDPILLMRDVRNAKTELNSTMECSGLGGLVRAGR